MCYGHDVDIDKKYQKIINKVRRGFYLRILSLNKEFLNEKK